MKLFSTNTERYLGAIAALSCVVAACSAAPGDGTGSANTKEGSPVAAEKSAPSVTTTAGTTTLAESPSGVKTKMIWQEVLDESGHTVTFFERGVGHPLILEEGKVGTSKIVSPDLSNAGFTAVYQAIRPQAEVPQALVEADARRAAKHLARGESAVQHGTKAKPVFAPAAVEPAAAGKESADPGEHALVLKPENASQASWFNSTFCGYRGSPYNSYPRCVLGYTWDTSGTTPETGGEESTAAMLGSEATATASYVVNYWSCWHSGFLDLGTTCGWNGLASTTVPPGWWKSWTNGTAGNEAPWQFSAALTSPSGTNGNATADLMLAYTPVGGGSSSPPPSGDDDDDCGCGS